MKPQTALDEVNRPRHFRTKDWLLIGIIFFMLTTLIAWLGDGSLYWMQRSYRWQGTAEYYEELYETQGGVLANQIDENHDLKMKLRESQKQVESCKRLILEKNLPGITEPKRVKP